MHMLGIQMLAAFYTLMCVGAVIEHVFFNPDSTQTGVRQ